MYATIAALRWNDASGDRELVEPEVVVDIIWASALPTDRLQHVRVSESVEHGVLNVVLLMHAAGVEAAVCVGEALLDRSAIASRRLIGWRFSTVSAALL